MTSRSEPTCKRCPNELDLVQWYDGEVYCAHCLQCLCIQPPRHNKICLVCLRWLHSTATYEGYQIWSIAAYIADAWLNYGVPAEYLVAWTYTEAEALIEAPEALRTHGPARQPRVAPPHHRAALTTGGHRQSVPP